LWFLKPQFATKNHTVTLVPPPWWYGEENQKEKGKTHGLDENSLTEWQREKKTTINNTDKKHIQHAAFLPPNAQLAPV